MPGQGVAGGNGCDDGLVEQQFLIDIRVLYAHPAKTDINLPRFQGVHLLPCFQFVQDDFQILVAPQASDHQWQLPVEHGGYEADGENGFAVLGDPAGVADGCGYLVENLPRLFKKVFTASRQHQPPGLPDEQRNPHFFFQLFDGSGQRGLGDKQLFCRTGEVQFLCHRHEVAQVSQLHPYLQGIASYLINIGSHT